MIKQTPVESDRYCQGTVWNPKKRMMMTILSFIILSFILTSACVPISEPISNSNMTSTMAMSTSYYCSGTNTCSVLDQDQCIRRSGCWWGRGSGFEYLPATCNNNSEGLTKITACYEYTSSAECNTQGGCSWVPWPEPSNTDESDNSGNEIAKPSMNFEELVLNGFTVLTTDWDRDNITESVKHNDYLIGIVKSNTIGQSFVSWYAYQWIDHEGTQTGLAWPLAAISGFQRGNFAFGDDQLAGDTYFTGDFDGDGRKDLVVWNRLEQRIAIVKERDGKLTVGAISSDWVNNIGQSGPEGWNLGKDDYISPGKFYGSDERTELLIKSQNGQWIGLLEEHQGNLVLRSIEHDWVNFEGGIGKTGWNLGENDLLIEGDFDGNGQIDLVILNEDMQWLGLLETNPTGKIITLWIGHDWVNSEGGAGKTGWNLGENDHFSVRSSGNGYDEIVVTSGNGRWQGVIFRKNNRLYARQISRLR